jgi:hypothetical protein
LAGAYAIEKDKDKYIYTQQWNLSVQRQLATDWSLTMSYLGNKTTHTWSTVNINPGVYVFNGTASCTLSNGVVVTGSGNQCSTTSNVQTRRRLNLINPNEGKYFSTITQLEDGGNANYNGGVASLQKRLSKGYSVLTNYTWSHCINVDDARQIQASGGVYTQLYDRDADRGDCGGDVRQLFNLSGVVATPKFGSRAMQAIASGWQLSTIYRKQTGSVLTVSTGRDNTLNGNGNSRADMIGNSKLSNPTADKWFDTAAFVPNALGTFGTSGRNNLRGPGAWNIDMGLTRKFSFKETQTLEFRAEGFNILNHTRLGSPNTSLTSTDYGRIRSAGDPRILQFALKYVF